MILDNPGEQLRLYQATVMLLSGQPNRPVDVLFVHSHALGDYTGLFEIAGDYFHRGRARFIAVTNNEGERFGSTLPFEANPGKTESIRILREEQLIPRQEDIPVPEMAAFHTRQENDAFLELSIKNNWTRGIILAQPHRLLRATLGMVQAMQQTRYIMEIYTITPNSTPWQEIAYGNQGLKLQLRFEHIAEELGRVCKYQASGELASFDELITYLEKRDTGRLLVGSIGRKRFEI